VLETSVGRSVQKLHFHFPAFFLNILKIMEKVPTQWANINSTANCQGTRLPEFEETGDDVLWFLETFCGESKPERDELFVDFPF